MEAVHVRQCQGEAQSLKEIQDAKQPLWTFLAPSLSFIEFMTSDLDLLNLGGGRRAKLLKKSPEVHYIILTYLFISGRKGLTSGYLHLLHSYLKAQPQELFAYLDEDDLKPHAWNISKAYL